MNMGTRKLSNHWLLLPAVLLLLAFFFIPTLDIIRSSVFDPDFTGEHFTRIYERSVYLRVLLWTIELSFIVSLLCAAIGYPVSYFLVQRPRSQQFYLLFLIFIPLWMSILIRSYAWMVLLGREGIINMALIGSGLTDEPVRMLFTTGTVIVAMIQILLPIQIVTCYSAMSEIDLSLIRAARVLGAKPRQALARVFIPLSLDGTFTGVSIVFMLSMGFFITPALVGGRKDLMIANLIDFQVNHLNLGFAAALGVVLLTSAIVGVIAIRWFSRWLTRWLIGGKAA